MKNAVMIVLVKDGAFLLGKRASYKTKAPGYWCPISGHLESGESEEEAVFRESAEELGVSVRLLRKIATTPTHDGSVLLHWWLAEITSGTPKITNNENSEIGWFTKAQLMSLSPVFKEDIEILLSL